MASTDTERDQVIESRRQQIREHSDRRRPAPHRAGAPLDDSPVAAGPDTAQ